MKAVWQDVRYGLRVLGRTPGWTALAATMLACGIGASASAFSLAHALFWQPLPARDAARLVQVNQTLAWRMGEATFGLSYPDYLYYRERGRSFTALAAHYSTAPLHLQSGADVWDVNGSVVSANYFELLGLEPVLGRFFTLDEETVRDTHRVAVVSYDLWQRELAASPAVLQQPLSINGEPFTIVGVAPRGFRGIVPGVLRTKVWIPSGMFRVGYRGCDGFTRECRIVQMLGRLAPGSGIARAQSELDTLATQLETAFPDVNKGRGVRVLPATGVRLQEQAQHATGASLMAGAAGLVLAIACTNLAGLLLSRGISRRREIAVRLALGGARRRIVRQLLIESLLLALAGGAAGVLVAIWGNQLLQSFYGLAYTGADLNFELDLNPAVLAFTLLLTITTGVLFGLAPAVRTSRADVLPALKDDAPSIMAGASRGRDLLVIAQIALAVVLLTGASLLARSVDYLEQGPGFDATRVAIFRVRPALVGFDRVRSRRFQEQAIQRLEAIGGVASASPAAYPPFPRWGPEVTVSWPDRAEAPRTAGVDGTSAGLQARQNSVGPRYLETMGLALLRGREFDASDRAGSQPVVMVNETLARRLWNSLDAVGRAITVDGAAYQIVGVAPDAQYAGPAVPPTPFVYFNYWQRDALQGDSHTHVRARGDAQPLLPLIREAITSVDRDVPIGLVQRLSEAARFEFTPVRAMRGALIWFGAVGTLLSAIGLYGLLAFTVTARAREMAIRAAVGAMPRDLVRQLAARSATLLAAGVGVGLASATAAARFVNGLLYGVAGVDVTTLATVSLALGVVAALASYVPARRIAGIDPASVFRSQ